MHFHCGSLFYRILAKRRRLDSANIKEKVVAGLEICVAIQATIGICGWWERTYSPGEQRLLAVSTAARLPNFQKIFYRLHWLLTRQWPLVGLRYPQRQNTISTFTCPPTAPMTGKGKSVSSVPNLQWLT